MAKQSLRPILYKTIFQIRFKPKLKFQPVIFSELEAIEADYGDWQTDGSTTVLNNFERRCSLLLRLDLIHFEQDSESSETEAKGIGHALAVARDHFGLKVLERTALKRSYLLPIEELNFQSLVAILNVKLLSQETALRRAVPGTAKDLMYRVDMREGNRQYNLLAGAVKKEEVPKFMPFNANFSLKPEGRAQEHAKILDAYPPLSLLFDIDYFQQDPKPNMDEAEPFVAAAMERSLGAAQGLATYLLSKKDGG
jgi:hypothetical protein